MAKRFYFVKMKPSYLIIGMLFFKALILYPAMAQNKRDFVEVQQGRLVMNEQPYVFMGTNFWYGMNLGSEGPGGDRVRLMQELDQLQSLGILNLRIIAASEGPLDAPWSLQPCLQYEKGQFDEKLFEGLDFLLDEMRKRKMKAVLCLNNFWPWSGGMSRYVAWERGDSIPFPPPEPKGDWHRYQLYTAQFYQNASAQKAFLDFVSKLINRINHLSKIPYKDDPTIMAWQLANEPRGMMQRKAYLNWVKETARFIKSMDSQHLVSVGSEGKTPFGLYAGTLYKKIHQIPEIDYVTFHIWIQNWMWYNPLHHEQSFKKALKKARRYLNHHVRTAKRLGKPAVLEEFGIARDQNEYAHTTPCTARDSYYKAMFEEIYKWIQKDGGMAGCNFWAWGGVGRPREAGGHWKRGDDFIGDPPHESQGWYSVYDQDHSTLEIIQRWASKFDPKN